MKRLILDPSRLRQDQCWDSGLPAHTYCFLAFLFLNRLKGASKRRFGWWSATPRPANWATRRKRLNLAEPYLLFSVRGGNTGQGCFIGLSFKIKQNRMYLKDTGEFYREHRRGRLRQIGLGSSHTESVSEVGPCYLHSDVTLPR